MGTFHPDTVASFIQIWLLDYLASSGQSGWVVGVSGGIDSAVTATLCARTERPTILVEMPIHQDPTQASRGREHMEGLSAKYANVKLLTCDLTGVFDAFSSALPEQKDASNGLALANARARVRMTALYAMAQKSGSLVVGTGNKIEDFGVGFFTKYGDGGVDLSPIADLMKTEVFALGAFLEVPQCIQEASPTDGLWGDDRTDEEQIGASYPELEWAMQQVGGEDETKMWTPRQVEIMGIYRRLNRANQHKMKPIPVCRIPSHVRYNS